MLIDKLLDVSRIGTSAEQASAAERAGYDGVFTAEAMHDPFLPLALAATSTSTVQLGTAVAIAFARSPMTVANTAYDLQLLSKGRFTLGLGSQIRPHITKRFGMPWSKPAARMREFVLALDAIWSSWERGIPLAFRGEFYSHTLMTPMFSPGPNEYGRAKVWLAGVGPAMVEVAGEIADGIVCHPLLSTSYLADVVKPALAAGARTSGRAVADVEVAGMVMLGLHDDDASYATALAGVRRQVAFYGSTPAYRPVLDAHGWGAAHEQLNAMTKRGEWAAIGDVVTEEMAHTFAVFGRPAEAAAELDRRYGSEFSRVSVSTPFQPAGALLDEFRRAVVR